MDSLYDQVLARAEGGIRVIPGEALTGHVEAGEARFQAGLYSMHHWCRVNERMVIDRFGGEARVWAGFEKLSRVRGVRRRYAALSQAAGALTLFGLPDWQVPFDARCVPVRAGALLEEWFVAVRSPDYAALIIARDLNGVDAAPSERRFEGLASHDPQVVDLAIDFLEREAARLLAA